MGKLPIILIVPYCLFGCTEGSDSEPPTETTPSGYRVAFESQGLLNGYATKQEIYDAFDLAMLKAAEYLSTKYGIGYDEVLGLPKTHGLYFILKDHFRFLAGGQVWATGQEAAPKIIVAMHRKHSAPYGASFPAQALPWSHVYGSQQVNIYWAQMDLTDSFPALGHELGHVIYGPGFEH